MMNTVTITHHQTKPEYQWELVVPEERTVMLKEDNFTAALDVLGLTRDHALRQQVEALPNGESRSVDAEITPDTMERLIALGVKSK